MAAPGIRLRTVPAMPGTASHVHAINFGLEGVRRMFISVTGTAKHEGNDWNAARWWNICIFRSQAFLEGTEQGVVEGGLASTLRVMSIIVFVTPPGLKWLFRGQFAGAYLPRPPLGRYFYVPLLFEGPEDSIRWIYSNLPEKLNSIMETRVYYINCKARRPEP